MGKKVTSQDLAKKVSATSANDLVAKVKAAASQLVGSVKAAQLNFNEITKDIKADFQNVVSAVNVLYSVDVFALELIESGTIIDDVTIQMIKGLFEQQIVSDLISQKDVTKLLGDIVTLNESLAFAYSKALEEMSTTIPDEVDLYLGKIKEDTSAAADSVEKLVSKALTETSSINQDDTVQYIKILGSALNVAPEVGYFAAGLYNTTFFSGAANVITGINFNTDLNTTTTYSLFFARSYVTGVSSSTAGYLANGVLNNNAYTNAVEKYNFSSASSSIINSTSISRYGAAGVESDTRGYYLGGFTTGSYLNEIDGVQFSNDAYINPSAALPSSRWYAAGFSSLQKGYVSSGLVIGIYSTTTDGILFSNETAFTLSAVLDLGAFGSASAESTTRGYIFGGQRTTGLINTIRHLKFANETYVYEAVNLNVAREGLAGISSANSAYIAGGLYSPIEKFNYATSTRTALSATVPTFSGNSSWASAGIQPKFRRQTTGVITDNISQKNVVKSRTDTARGTDAITRKTVTQGKTETLRGTDTLALFASKSIPQEILEAAVLIEKYFSKQTTAETASSSDTTTKQPIKGLTDTASAGAEVVTKIIGKFLTDNISTFEGVTGFDGTSFVLDNTETNTSSAFDVFSRAVTYVRSGAAYNLTDTSRATDTITTKGVGKGLSDTARGTDVATKQSIKGLSDTARGTDVATKQPNKGLSDTARGTDLITQKNVSKSGIADTSRGTDLITQKDVSKSGIADTSRGTDDQTNQFQKVLGNVYQSVERDNLLSEYLDIPNDIQETLDPAGILYSSSDPNTTRATDTVTRRPGKGLGDTARASDSVSAITAGKGLSDTARGIDSFSRAVTYLRSGATYGMADISRATDARTLQFNKTAGGEGTDGQTDFTGIDYNQELIFPSLKYDRTRVFDEITSRTVGKGLSDTARASDTLTRTVAFVRSGPLYNLNDIARGTDARSSQFTKIVNAGVNPRLTEFTPINYQQDLLDQLPYSPERINATDAQSFTRGLGLGYERTSEFNLSNGGTAAYQAGGYTGVNTASIAKFVFSGEVTSTTSALLVLARAFSIGVSSLTRGYSLGGPRAASEINQREIDGIQYSNDTAINPSSTLSVGKSNGAGISSIPLDAGYAVSGESATIIANNTQKLSYSTETVSLNSSTIAIAREWFTGLEYTNGLRAYVANGSSIYNNISGRVSIIDRFLMDTEVFTSLSATTSIAKFGSAGVASFRHGFWMGGFITTYTSIIDGITFSNESAITPSASLSVPRNSAFKAQSPINGYALGGWLGSVSAEIDGINFTTLSSYNPSATLPTGRTEGASFTIPVSSAVKPTTARGTDVTTKQPNKGLSDTARGTDLITTKGIGKGLSDTSRGTDTRTTQFTKVAGGEGTYVDLDVAGIGSIPNEIVQFYNRRNYQPLQYQTPPTIIINTYNFSPISSGANGPSNLTAANFTSTDTLIPIITNGYISFPVNETRPYTFDITGASGGVFTSQPPNTPAAPIIAGFKRAPGARVVGTVNLTQGQTVTMVIGQGGGDDTTGIGGNPGGGGGTFVTLGTYADVVAGTDTLLFAAGGGGGGSFVSADTPTDNYLAGIGQASNNGGTSNVAGGTFGNGAAGQTSLNSTGGGGYFTSTDLNTASAFGSASVDRFSRGFRQGAVGSRNGGSAIGIGGFGGGGSGSSQASSDDDKGGGGGYSGGAYGYDAEMYGGGGGSYAIPSATSVTITAGGGTTLNGTVNIVTTGAAIILQPTSATYTRIEQTTVFDTPVKLVTRVLTTLESRTKQTEFTPINYTQDLLQIIQAD